MAVLDRFAGLRGKTDGMKREGCAVFWDALAKILRDLFKNKEMHKHRLVIAKIQHAAH